MAGGGRNDCAAFEAPDGSTGRIQNHMHAHPIRTNHPPHPGSDAQGRTPRPHSDAFNPTQTHPTPLRHTQPALRAHQSEELIDSVQGGEQFEVGLLHDVRVVDCAHGWGGGGLGGWVVGGAGM